MKTILNDGCIPPSTAGASARERQARDRQAIERRAGDGLRCDERRIMGVALSWWDQARQGQPEAPLSAAPLEDPVLGPHLYLVRVDGSFPDSVILHCGGSLEALCGTAVVSRRVGEIFPRAMAEDMVDYLAAAARTGKPMAQSGSLVRRDGLEILYRDAVMPVRASADDPLCLLGALSFRVAGR